MLHAHSHNPQTPEGGGVSRIAIVPQRAGGALRLVVTGELDLTTFGEFCQALIDETDRPTREPLVLDLSGVGYADGRTWTVIVQASRRLAAQGRPFSVALAAGSQPERVYVLRRAGQVVARA